MSDRPGRTVSLAARGLGFGVFALALASYYSTMQRGIPFGDAGELAGAASTLGIAHAPGYPLYTIAGHIWTLLIPGREIFAMNLFSAVCVAGGAWVFYKIALLLSPLFRKQPNGPVTLQELATSVLAALTFAWARTVWSQSTGTEVYGLEILLYLSMLYFALRAFAQPERAGQSWILAACFLGLNLAHHPTVGVAIPALLWLFWRSKQQGYVPLSKLAPMALATLAPLLLYFYMPMRSASAFIFGGQPAPSFDHGDTGHGWGNLLDAITAKGFKGYIDAGAAGSSLSKFFSEMPSQFGFVGLALLLLGLYALYRSQRWLLGFFALQISLTVLTFMNYNVFDVTTFFLPAFAGLLLVFAIGGLWLTQRLDYGPAVMLAPAAINWIANAPKVASPSDVLGEEMIENYARNVEPNALIVTNLWFQFTSGFLYKQGAEGYRKDLLVFRPTDASKFDFYLPQFMREHPEIMKGSEALVTQYEASKGQSPEARNTILAQLVTSMALNAGRPVYLGGEYIGDGQPFVQKLELTPAGFSFKATPKGVPPPMIIPQFSFDKMLGVESLQPDDNEAKSYFISSAGMLNMEIGFLRSVGKAQEAQVLQDQLDKIGRRVAELKSKP